jgi:curved DNA-binding protein CbpA
MSQSPPALDLDAVDLEALDLARLLEWDATLDRVSYYEILGLSQGDDREQVRHAFHAFALAFHPDSFQGFDPETQARVQRVFERGVEAYRTLADPERRSDYDLALAKGELRLGKRVRRDGVGVGARSLDEICRSPGAKLHAKRAEQMLTQGDLKQAHLELWRAVRAEDGPNPELMERIEAVEAFQDVAGEAW